MHKSRSIAQEKIYVRFDKSGNTSLVSQNQLTPGYSYRRVHDTHQSDKTLKRIILGTMFEDPEFQIESQDVENLDPNNRRIIIRRLSQLVKNQPKYSVKPYFFPPANYVPPRKLSRDPFLPPFITQLGVFPVQYYKTFFLTQDFSEDGLYQVIINQKGRFQTDVVDDYIPIYEDSMEPIWGMQFDQSWQLILLKFWAKKCGGYSKVYNTPPYTFLQCFSNSNWKYFNLYRQGYTFLARYAGKTDMGKIILKTKSTDEVYKSGLIPNSAGYEVISLNENMQGSKIHRQNSSGSKIHNYSDAKDRRYVALVRSTMNNKWSGKMSVLDHEINKRYFPQQYTMALQRDFMMTQHDLINLFSSAYVASRRDEKQQNYISDYYIFQVEPQNKKSIYIKFSIPENGWFDFCIKQYDDNKFRPYPAASQIRIEQYNKNEGIVGDGTRYLKMKYILVKQNTNQSPSTMIDWDYQQPRYDNYQIQYSHGYNRGDARFLDVVPGTYILKIKPESSEKRTYFVLNYASSSVLEMHEYFPTKQESSLILRQSMASLIGIVQHYHLDKNVKYEQICFSNTFQELGYGFVGVRSKKACPYRILIEIDPMSVRNSGYKIKNQFKTINESFSIIVNPGECSSVVLKKIQNMKHQWPPRGIQVYRER